jgi:hypothetical protein
MTVGTEAVDSVRGAWKTGTYRRCNIIVSGHPVRNVRMCRVESFLNNSNKRVAVVLKVSKGVLRNEQEMGEGWEKNLSPGRLTNEILCVGDGNHNAGSVHSRGLSALLLRQSSDLQLRFLRRLIDGDIGAGTDLRFVSNDMVTRTRYAYNRNPATFTLDAAGQTNQLILV